MDVAGSTEARKDHSKMETTARELTLQCGVIFIANLRERDGRGREERYRERKIITDFFSFRKTHNYRILKSLHKLRHKLIERFAITPITSKEKS